MSSSCCRSRASVPFVRHDHAAEARRWQTGRLDGIDHANPTGDALPTSSWSDLIRPSQAPHNRKIVPMAILGSSPRMTVGTRSVPPHYAYTDAHGHLHATPKNPCPDFPKSASSRHGGVSPSSRKGPRRQDASPHDRGSHVQAGVRLRGSQDSARLISTKKSRAPIPEYRPRTIANGPGSNKSGGQNAYPSNATGQPRGAAL